jgi:hypothetical protein
MAGKCGFMMPSQSLAETFKTPAQKNGAKTRIHDAGTQEEAAHVAAEEGRGGAQEGAGEQRLISERVSLKKMS